MMAFDYIDLYKNEAVKQMLLHRIPASVILAQAIFESGCGKSELAQRSNNHFGIKCHQAWIGDTVVKSDDTDDECFRKYVRVQDSYADHSRFLRTRVRYLQLFDLPLTDYRGWCRGLKLAGYATFPTYAEELIRIIEANQLYKLDAVEELTPKTLKPRPEPTLKRSPLRARCTNLVLLAETDLLFSDERDIVVRSLRLLPEDRRERQVMARK
jgi:flagellum-specific peptidoglycan hydrolase FlgJ